MDSNIFNIYILSFILSFNFMFNGMRYFYASLFLYTLRMQHILIFKSFYNIVVYFYFESFEITYQYCRG